MVGMLPAPKPEGVVLLEAPEERLPAVGLLRPLERLLFGALLNLGSWYCACTIVAKVKAVKVKKWRKGKREGIRGFLVSEKGTGVLAAVIRIQDCARSSLGRGLNKLMGEHQRCRIIRA